ncbi:MAG: hypothetical protein M0P69_10075 [Bacteroidales bacterium]|nr:hypothetical protein [Bacteroidales bacterium]
MRKLSSGHSWKEKLKREEKILNMDKQPPFMLQCWKMLEGGRLDVRKRCKMWILCIVLVLVLILVIGCGQGDKKEEADKLSETKEVTQEEAPENKKDFKIICEENAEKFPASAGKVLFDNAQYKFKGMNYYFKGEVVGGITLETTVGDGKAWLVRNEAGYVMPVYKDRFEAETGDIVEVWGTLSGLKYASSDFGVDNVVGATGAIHAMQVSVNGEMQY